jgi:hypothetical protein
LLTERSYAKAGTSRSDSGEAASAARPASLFIHWCGRSIASGRFAGAGLVADGRDMGTVVFPTPAQGVCDGNPEERARAA